MATPGPEDEPVDQYAGGEIGVRHGRVPIWLRLVYAALAVWGAYYLVAWWRVG
jgi:hypothetical protein